MNRDRWIRRRPRQQQQQLCCYHFLLLLLGWFLFFPQNWSWKRLQSRMWLRECPTFPAMKKKTKHCQKNPQTVVDVLELILSLTSLLASSFSLLLLLLSDVFDALLLLGLLLPLAVRSFLLPPGDLTGVEAFVGVADVAWRKQKYTHLKKNTKKSSRSCYLCFSGSGFCLDLSWRLPSGLRGDPAGRALCIVVNAGLTVCTSAPIKTAIGD